MKTLKMILFLMVLGLTINAQNIDLQKGLIGHWTFDNNLVDQSDSSGNAQGYNIKYTYDLKKTYVALKWANIDLKNVTFDAMIGASLLDYNIKDDIAYLGNNI